MQPQDKPRRGEYARLYEEAVQSLDSLRGDALLDRMQEIVELTRRHGDETATVAWRRECIQVASRLGRVDRKLALFREMMESYERQPGARDLRRDALWYYKWIVDEVQSHAEVPIEQVEALLTQMEAFYEREGESLAPVYALRYRLAAFIGEPEAAEHWRSRWEESRGGDFDDCAACQTNLLVTAALNLGRWEEAVDLAEPVLRGDEYCEQVPAVTFSRLLMPMLAMGAGELTVRMHRAVRRQVRATPSMLDSLAEHVVYVAAVGGRQTARRLACTTMRRLSDAPDSYARFIATRALWVWLSQRQAAGLAPELPARALAALPEPARHPDSLAGWLNAQMRTLAQAFDTRHGTTRFAGLIAEAEQLAGLDIRDD